VKTVYGIAEYVIYLLTQALFIYILCSMESSELPHLPLGSQVPSGFNPHDVPSFQGFSPAHIDHSLQAASNFVRIYTPWYAGLTIH
jgi:hypothetical protein